jgi:hypothetical protein
MNGCRLLFLIPDALPSPGDSAVREWLLLVLGLVLPTAGDERQRPVRDSARVRSALPPQAVKLDPVRDLRILLLLLLLRIT